MTITKESILKELQIAANDLANVVDNEISWDFVSADLYWVLNPQTEEDEKLIDETLNQFANYYEDA